MLTFAGLAKALEPDHFVRHLKNLRLLAEPLLLPAALMTIALQVGLGLALLLRLWPAVLLPAALLLLLALATLGYWSTTTGRTADCGCYNGLITLSPLQSLLLEAGYAALLGFAWLWGIPAPEHQGWRAAAALLAAVGSGGLAFGLLGYSARQGRPLFELSPMRVGRRWRAAWLPAGSSLPAGDAETLIVFLGANCSHCMKWIKILNTVHGLPNLPAVHGVVTIPGPQLADYRTRAAVRFPVAAVSPWVAARLSRSITPTAVLVRDGIIREKWVRSMPKSFTDRLRTERPAAF